MIREDRFLISHKAYAVDLSSLRGAVTPSPQGRRPSYFDGRINAVWFRRRRGVTVACIGTLWDFQDDDPADGRRFLERHEDGRYGGDCDGRWDGSGYWGAQNLETVAQHLTVLRPMLAAYPAIPDGYDGWWRFA
ncbi:hypothetical protein [Streptomyces sp. NBC_01565]|uniref:hypothetical protein n=1 Tax=Streptomyces sp. NBC_01565 TaxID=2975881 RepID=UPI00224EA9D5|nr:hypothetical protein [Streptomyces sp. NBC_01565]MCX4543813.1 hypothetical protein [Streptomyces sp. NBC_01565]